ncbi:hypothetical protein A1353_18965 [Methylomonas methanica]|uniref:MobA/VirD2-like nuclease domain-containing protein n=1 Tax=Methylomonas methanica TaxID=421 RepID=A0A177M6G6_METMH|nr:relaxase/mobilization nuclease domain-containing protein [Methylomonas methanica]OAI00893.1 hypothetical protein A1353_18965 [Methylomonas methanica]
MPKKRTAVVSRDKTAPGLDLVSRGRKGPKALFHPSSPASMESLRRTLNRVPEVMVKVTGGGRDPETAEAHIDYIDRKGELEVLTDEGESLKGRDVSEFLVRDWKLDTIINKRNREAPEAGEKDKRAKLVHNIVLSMPQGTPPQSVLAAAQHFARENFALSHRYAMVLHDPATDPKHDKTESGKNPHVHLVVKAVSETGERLYIRKDTLQNWREQFAQALRDHGVEANATPAAIRGRGKSSAKTSMHQHQERIEKWQNGPQDEHTKPPVASTFLQERIGEVFNDVINGVAPDSPGKEILKTTRQWVIEDWKATEQELRNAGFEKDADQVAEFIKSLPSVKSDYDVLKEKILGDTDRFQAALGRVDVVAPVENSPSKGAEHSPER